MTWYFPGGLRGKACYSIKAILIWARHFKE
jgi:hypothetical protein